MKDLVKLKMSIHTVPFLLQLASGMEVFLINFTLYNRLLFLQTPYLEVVDQPRTKCKPIEKTSETKRLLPVGIDFTKQTNLNKTKIRLTAPVSSFSEEILPLNKLK